MNDRTVKPTDVAIIGAGPAGLAAAADWPPPTAAACWSWNAKPPRWNPQALRPSRLRDARHAHLHQRSRIRAPAGRQAREAGAEILTEAMVTAMDRTTLGGRHHPAGPPAGRRPARSSLATGARERPRPARLIPGDRPSGVYTTGQLQNLVHLHHGKVGKRAVVVGAELVSWSAVMTLRHAGCATVAMTTLYPSPESYARLQPAGQVAAAGAGRDSYPRRADHREARPAGRRGGEHRHRGAPDHRLRHRRLHRRLDPRPRTGPQRRASTSTPAPKAPSSIPRCAPAGRAFSPQATCCIPSTPPTSPHSTAHSSPTASRHTCARHPPPRDRWGSGSRPRHPSVGCRRICCAQAIPPRRASGCCCGRIG